MKDDENDKWTSVRLSKNLHKFIGEKGNKSETYEETIARLIGYNVEEK